MLDRPASETNQTAEDRETRRRQILQALRREADAVLERMADQLADLPEDQSFGQIELDLREMAHGLATTAHQAGLDAGKKRGT